MEGKNRNFPDSYFEIVCDKLNENYTGLSFDQQMEYLLIDKYTQFREDEMKLTKEDLENRKDHTKCGPFVKASGVLHRPRYGCGLCQTGVPCESSIPG